MNNADNLSPTFPVPEPEDPVARRREKLMAYHLDALDEDEAALIRGRIESDPEWKAVSTEALAMIEGLRADGAPSGEVPEGLGERTAEKLRQEGAEGKQEEKRALSAVPFAFTVRRAAAVFLVASLPALWLGARYVFSRPERVSILWRAEGELAAGAPYAPFLMVRGTKDKGPIEGVKLSARLEAEGGERGAVGEGTSDATGVVSGEGWCVPEVPPGDYRLIVEARSAGGSLLDRVEREVKVKTAARLAIAPDRSQARPGEKIRVRTLLATEAGSKPLAGKPVAIDLLDPEGNRIARREVDSSEFGLAWAEFPLDSQAREGSYVVRAETDGLKAERHVQVKQYRLPAYRIDVALDQSWYKVSDPVTGTLTAATFDGRPVAGAKGEAKLVRDDGAVLRRAEIVLDGEGAGRIALAPVGKSGLAGEEAASLRLEVSLTDPVGRRAEKKTLVRVSRTPVLVWGVAEGRELVQGVENIVYIVVRRPDGSPVSGDLQVVREGSGERARAVRADEHGVAELRISDPKEPAEVLLVDGQGHGFEARRVSIPVRPLEQKGPGVFGGLLLRTDRAVVSAGEALKVTLLAARRDGAAVVALRQDGRPVAAAGVDLEDGRGEAAVAVPPGLSGMLTLDAMLQVEGRGYWTDTRTVSVRGDARIRLAAVADRPRYRPGDTARLDFTVTDAAGVGLPSAVSVVAVDEALLALTGDHPGLAQALQAAGANVLRTPGFPLEASEFGPEEGEEPAVHAALAAVLPQGPDGAGDRIEGMLKMRLIDERTAEQMRQLIGDPMAGEGRVERQRMVQLLKEQDLWEDVRAVLGLGDGGPVPGTIIDTSPRKVAEYRQYRRELASHLAQWLLGLLGIGLVLFVVARAWHAHDSVEAEALRRALRSIPLVTLTVVAVGAAGFVCLLEGQPGTLIPILAGSLVVGHVLLLIRAGALRRRGRESGVDVSDAAAAVAITDVLALLFALGVVGKAHEPDVYGLAVCLAIGMLFAAFLQHRVCLPVEKRGGLLANLFVGAFVFAVVAAIAVPSLMGARYSSNEAVFTSRARTLLGADNMFRRLHPEESGRAAAESAVPRLRWDFPETWIFAPQIVTDAAGRATLELPVADSLTSWRVQADAIAARGGTAWTKTGVIVTQPFSVDLVLPTDVTAGDLLYVPAVVSNHTPQPRTVELTLRATGATLIEGAERTITLRPKAAASAEFALRFDAPGTASLELTALAGGESDAVRRTLVVIPDGEPVAFAASSLVSDEGELEVVVPGQAIPGTIRAELRLHRGPLSQVMEGLEGMLRQPYGCFEQTSSCTYPNVLVLQYLRATGAAKPEVEKEALGYIATGYQRLLGFEVGSKSGSFSLYGKVPASAWLTAYGLMEFADMAEVYSVDPGLLERIKAWLLSQAKGDGSFPMRRRGLDVAGTAYAVWALGKDAPEASVRYLRERSSQVEKDAYLCALVSNALAKKDRATASYLAGKLRGLATVNAGKTATLGAERTLAWGYGYTASAEATALGVLALLETGRDMELAKMFIASLQSNVSGGRGWGSTHATILALKALVRTASVGRKAGPARVVAEVNGMPLAPVDLPAEETAVPVSVPLELAPGKSRVVLRVSGGPVAARVSGQAYVPWTGEPSALASAVNASVSYSAARVEKGGAVLGTLTAKAEGRTAEVPMVEWGLPAGFVAEAEDLDSLRSEGKLSHWEVSGRFLRLYLPDLEPGNPVAIPVRFYATAKGTLKGPAGKAYEYYRRHEAQALEPTRFEVF